MSSITTLSYATYRQIPETTSPLAIALQLNIDYDLNDASTGYQGRLVYEPYLSGQSVSAATWQTWDTRAGRWWGTRASVTVNGVATANACVQSSPCSWSQLLLGFPNLGIHQSYGAVVLKAGSGWSSFRGNVDALRIGVDGIDTVYDFEAVRAAAVPATPPDSVPAEIDDPARYVGENGTKIHRSILLLDFEDSVSQATRTQIIQSIGGTVVGGEPAPGGGDGPYYVRVAEDSTGDVNLALGARLDSLPTMIAAYPMWLATGDDVLAYRKPKRTDRPDWSDWELDPTKIKSTTQNWAFEAIRAPMAWGCETGSAATVVATLDMFYHTESELRSNRAFTSHRDIRQYTQSNEGTWHGNGTSQIIAARGDDQLGMTGVMWNASLRQYEIGLLATNPTTGAVSYADQQPTFSARSVADGLNAAVRAGSRVVNISLQNPLLTRPQTRRDTANARNYARTLVRTLRRLEGQGRRLPLLVIAAGNRGIPAVDAGFPQLANDARFGNSVLVVGAAKFGTGSTFLSMSGPATGTNFGPEVKVYAPGQNIGGMAPNGANDFMTGTSFAAPFVSGVAGLLFSFDSTLTAADARRLLLEGASNGKREAVELVTGRLVPFLDAYEALKAAGREPGARLCGNHVFSTPNGDVFAERANGASQKLFNSTDGEPYTELLNVLHGGKRIQIGDYLEFKWKSKADALWEASTFDGGYHEDAGGTFLSWYDRSDHDATAEISSRGYLAYGQVEVVSYLWFPRTNEQERFLPMYVLPVRNSAAVFLCSRGRADSVVTGTGCGDNRDFSGSWDYPHLVTALAPQGNFMLQGVNYRHESQHYASRYSPGDGVVGQLVPTDNWRDSSVSMELWLVDTSASRPAKQVKVNHGTADSLSRAGLEINWLAVNETGTELVWQLQKNVRDDNAPTRYTCTNRVIEYRALPGHLTAPAGSLLRPPLVLADQAQQCVRAFGSATIAPYKSGVKGGRIDARQLKRQPLLESLLHGPAKPRN